MEKWVTQFNQTDSLRTCHALLMHLIYCFGSQSMPTLCWAEFQTRHVSRVLGSRWTRCDVGKTDSLKFKVGLSQCMPSGVAGRQMSCWMSTSNVYSASQSRVGSGCRERERWRTSRFFPWWAWRWSPSSISSACVWSSAVWNSAPWKKKPARKPIENEISLLRVWSFYKLRSLVWSEQLFWYIVGSEQ